LAWTYSAARRTGLRRPFGLLSYAGEAYVLFLFLALFLPLQAAPADECSLSGTVVDSVTGAPSARSNCASNRRPSNHPAPSPLRSKAARPVDLDPATITSRAPAAATSTCPTAPPTRCRRNSTAPRIRQAAPSRIQVDAAPSSRAVAIATANPSRALASADRLSYTEGPRSVEGEPARTPTTAGNTVSPASPRQVLHRRGTATQRHRGRGPFR